MVTSVDLDNTVLASPVHLLGDKIQLPPHLAAILQRMPHLRHMTFQADDLLINADLIRVDDDFRSDPVLVQRRVSQQFSYLLGQPGAVLLQDLRRPFFPGPRRPAPWP